MRPDSVYPSDLGPGVLRLWSNAKTGRLYPLDRNGLEDGPEQASQERLDLELIAWDLIVASRKSAMRTSAATESACILCIT